MNTYLVFSTRKIIFYPGDVFFLLFFTFTKFLNTYELSNTDLFSMLIRQKYKEKITSEYEIKHTKRDNFSPNLRFAV